MRKPKKLPIALTKEEFVKLIKSTKFPHWKVAFVLGFGAGMRISEVVKLEKRDVDFDKKSIHIRQGKGSKDRIVPIPKGFMPKHLKHLPMKCGARALQFAFHKTCEAAELLENKPGLHFHSLRHGFASHLAGKGVPIHHIRTLLGHSNISTTNVYLELNPTKALESYEEFF